MLSSMYDSPSWAAKAIRAAERWTITACTPIERLLVRRYGAQPPKHPPVFLVGAPRTGSTVLYQYVTNCMRVTYTDNLMCRYNRQFLLAAWLSRARNGDRRHNCYCSDHGSTKGEHAPSECGEFWYRWFPVDRHFVDVDEVDDSAIEEMRMAVRAVGNSLGRPVVFKNLNCGQRLRVLSRAFPDALLVFCRRDPLYVAQSIVEARDRTCGDRKQWWSVKPREVEKLLHREFDEQVVGQIYWIERQIQTDLQLFPKEQHIEVWYEDMCRNPRETLTRIHDLMAANSSSVEWRRDVPIAPIPCANFDRLDRETLSKLRAGIDGLDWTMSTARGEP